MYPHANMLVAGGGLVVNYLAEGGGGAGGGVVGGSSGRAGGGGAGQLKQGMLALSSGTTLAIVPGVGGIGVAASDGNPGSDTTIGSIVRALGGGYGASPTNHGGNGGNGGGGGSTNSGSSAGGAGDHNGAVGLTFQGGGGGGTAADASGSIGGPGTSSSISGAALTYGVGGNGNGSGFTSSAPGSGGVGVDATGFPTPGVDGAGDNGRAGIVVIAYLGAAKATGGTITSVGGNTIHTFTIPGTFTVL